MLYVNRRASLLNTTECARAYHQIQGGQEVNMEEKKYEFGRLEDVAKYW